MSWIDWLLGIDRARIPEAATFEFEFGAPPAGTPGLLALLAVALVAFGAIAFLLRESAGKKRAFRIAIGSSRLLAILLVACALMEPRIAVSSWQEIQARTIVLVDESLSMALQDAYADANRRASIGNALGLDADALADVSRSELVAHALLPPTGASVLDQLAQANRVHLYAYGAEPREIAVKGPDDFAAGADDEEVIAPPDAAASWLLPPPRTDATDLARALRAAVDDASGETIAAVIIIGDGRNNTGLDPVQVAKELLERRATPIFTLLAGDVSPPKNLRVVELLAPDRVFASDPILIEVAFESTGLDRLTTQIEVVQSALDGSGSKVVATLPIDLERDQNSALVPITVRADASGEYLFVARVPAVDDEISVDDNMRAVRITVIDDQTRVLLVAGGPSHEFQFVKELLRRETTVNLSVWLQSADREFPQEGDTPIRELPFTDEGLEEYDVVLLFDMDPIDLNLERIRALRRFVEEEGGGLGFVCGEQHALALMTDPANALLVEILPIVPDDDQARDFVGFGRHHATAWRYDITPEGVDNAITRFASDTLTNRKIWERLPGIYWHLPVARARPGAKVLATHSNPESVNRDGPHPLIVTHFYGPGRTLFLASDETHSWRSLAPRHFARFWLQAVRNLTQGKLLGGKDQLSITAEKETVHLGGVVGLEASARTPDRRPLEAGSLSARARTLAPGGSGEGSEREITLLAIPGRPGSFEGLLAPWTLGPLRISIEIEGESGAMARAEATISVLPPEREQTDPRADPALFRDLSEIGSGLALGIEEAAGLAERVPSRTRKVERPAAPIELWDSPLLVLLALLALGLEWILRKIANLL